MSLKNTDVRTPGDAAIAKKFKLSLAKIRQLVKVGAEHEKEHNTNLAKAKEVARDHIAERPDYYSMLKKAEKTKVSVKEETLTGEIRGLGNVTGDPAVGSNSYVDSNAMSYEDENGNKLAWIKKITNGHNAVGFKEFNPTELTKKVKLKEGISAGPERSADYSIGDPGGGRTLYRPLDVKEGAKLDKAKKALATGAVVANIATAGHVAGSAAEGRGSPKSDIVRAATTLPGPAGLAAKGINYAKMAYGKYKSMKEDKDPCWKGYQMVGMKKKGGRKVPNCVPVEEQGSPANPARYTERPMYELKKPETQLSSGEVSRGIYEGWASIGHAYDWAGDVNSNAKFVGKKPKSTTTKDDEKDDTYKDSNKGKKVKFAKTVKEEQIDELKAETLGAYIKKAAESRKKSLSGSKPDVKTWGKRQKGIKTAVNKLTREDIADKDWDDTTGKKLPENHNKPDTRYAPGATGITKTIYEETTMDTKELINEALDNILDNNLVDMKENLLTALQEKAMEKLEEKKKEIASNYFAQ